MEPGFYFDVPAAEYHSDPCETPSLSCSIAQLLVEETPRRAMHAHPRLNSEWQPGEPSRAMEEGSALHSLILGRGAAVVSLPFPDYKTQAARLARTEAREDGMVPILAERLRELEGIASWLRETIADIPEVRPILAESARSEVVFCWEEHGGMPCRGMVDRMIPDTLLPWFDLKFTTRIDPLASWDRRMVDNGWDLRSAYYRRGGEVLTGRPPPYVFLVCETEPPFDVLPLQCTPELLGLGEEKLDLALELWRECRQRGSWPGYARRVHHVGPPLWAMSQWSETQAMREQERAFRLAPPPPGGPAPRIGAG